MYDYMLQSFKGHTDQILHRSSAKFLPRILDHGRLLIMFAMTITELTQMETQTFGSGDSQTMIQL